MLRFALVLVVLFAGCGGTQHAYEDAALDRGSVAMSCPRRVMGSSYSGGGGVVVNGCGQSQSYTCARAHAAAVCSPDGPVTGTYVAPLAEGLVVAGPDRDQILAVVASCGLAPGEHIVVTIGAPGDVLRAATSACAQDALRRHTFAARPDAEVVEVVVPSLTPAPASTAAGPEVLARAIVDSLRDSILLCNGGAPIAVVAEWTADGALTVHLPDAHAGSAEDGCVRATAAGMRIDPAPGAAGTVLHALR